MHSFIHCGCFIKAPRVRSFNSLEEIFQHKTISHRFSVRCAIICPANSWCIGTNSWPNESHSQPGYSKTSTPFSSQSGSEVWYRFSCKFPSAIQPKKVLQVSTCQKTGTKPRCPSDSNTVYSCPRAIEGMPSFNRKAIVGRSGPRRVNHSARRSTANPSLPHLVTRDNFP